MKIYLDVFFLVNAGMNFSVFMMESFFQKRRIRLLRLLGSSALGAFFATLFLISGIHRYLMLSVLIYAAVSAILVRIAFGKTTVRTFTGNFILYYAASFVLSGVLQYLQGVLGIQGSMVLILAGTGGVLYLLYRFLPSLKKQTERNAAYIPVRLWYGGANVQGRGFLDTGNQLSEPFSGEPVIIGDLDFVIPLFKKEEPVFRYIPYHAIGTEHGTLRAFQAEYLELQRDGRVWEKRERPWVALYENPVSADGEYEMILHPELAQQILH